MCMPRAMYVPEEAVGRVVGSVAEGGAIVLDAVADDAAADDAAACPMLTKSASLIPSESPLLTQFVL